MLQVQSRPIRLSYKRTYIPLPAVWLASLPPLIVCWLLTLHIMAPQLSQVIALDVLVVCSECPSDWMTTVFGDPVAPARAMPRAPPEPWAPDPDDEWYGHNIAIVTESLQCIQHHSSSQYQSHTICG